MGLFGKLRGELIDIIEWLDDSRDTLVWRFPRHDNEIKMGARLVVRESQAAVFVNEGTIADTFDPGTYTLETRNLPVLSTLKGWKYGFESPFKAEVYFVNTRQFTDLKWGTQNPVIVRDAEFGMVRLRAFGAYTVRVVDPEKLLSELAGTDAQFRTDEVQEYLRQVIVARLSNALATAGVSVLDLAAHQSALGERLAEALTGELAGVGIEIPTFVIENISLPPEVEQALDRRSQLGIVGDLDSYTRLQTADALRDAVRNPGGGASEGLGLGLGVAMGQRLAAGLTPPASQGPPTPGTDSPDPVTPVAGSGAVAPGGGPPPLPTQEQWYAGIGGQQQGPFDRAGLAERVSGGAVTGTTLVWKAGMAAWTPAGELPELAPLLASAPPPLPPQP
ncbi:SPFH domain-containing protein [Solwaraspora sp. WMMD1047]|uniref:SPFH domain-containing protein n=1 Tax=Solwaraspora sp. WMMD1047 TaxID=3016102 RepID=UPI002416A906|nr:SPFH domain-containing protein [Solwaraspora sp. WMMD1047]MDG4833816.1 SPFH domain-containing protein [Solwaraspora sp. WMMD1047]